jgi:exodeoxyribonuclease VII small subunit
MTTPKPFEFEKALKELEDITTWFESSDVDLDQGLVKFERGMELAGQLKSHLATVENRVEKIKQRFAGATTAETEPPVTESELPEPTPAAEPTPHATPDDADQTGLFGA